jgi:hypothetical protein
MPYRRDQNNILYSDATDAFVSLQNSMIDMYRISCGTQ